MIIVVLLVFFVAFAIFVYPRIIVWSNENFDFLECWRSFNTETLGQLGDFWGGIVNPLLGFVTLFFLVLTWNTTQQQLALSEKQYKDQNNRHHNEMHNALISSYEDSKRETMAYFNDKLMCAMSDPIKHNNRVILPLTKLSITLNLLAKIKVMCTDPSFQNNQILSWRSRANSLLEELRNAKSHNCIGSIFSLLSSNHYLAADIKYSIERTALFEEFREDEKYLIDHYQANERYIRDAIRAIEKLSDDAFGGASRKTDLLDIYNAARPTTAM